MRAARTSGLALALTLALGQGAFMPVNAAPTSNGPVALSLDRTS